MISLCGQIGYSPLVNLSTKWKPCLRGFLPSQASRIHPKSFERHHGALDSPTDQHFLTYAALQHDARHAFPSRQPNSMGPRLNRYHLLRHSDVLNGQRGSLAR